MKLKYIFILFSVASVFIGCGKSSDSHQESVLLHSYRLIDQNKVDDAISLLTEESEKLESQPSDLNSQELANLKATLASAYAKKAGITIREIAKSADLTKKISTLSDQQANLIEKNGFLILDDNLKGLVGLLLTTLKMTKIISVLPKIKPANLIYIHQAIRILDSVQNLSPEDLIYSAILKIVYARNYLELVVLGSPKNKMVLVDNQCVANFTEFRDHLLVAVKILSSGFEDIGTAMPKRKKEMNISLTKLSELTGQLLSLKVTSIVLNRVNSNSTENIFSELGFGSQEFNCESNVPVSN